MASLIWTGKQHESLLGPSFMQARPVFPLTWNWQESHGPWPTLQNKWGMISTPRNPTTYVPSIQRSYWTSATALESMFQLMNIWWSKQRQAISQILFDDRKDSSFLSYQVVYNKLASTNPYQRSRCLLPSGHMILPLRSSRTSTMWREAFHAP